ncbi:MAG: calcium/sodium antiporter [Bacilli bacterium]|nr:calcium/sodium antiporter [Bacilli bacterium]
MIVNILILIVGFIILIYGADIFVDGASSLARNFKLSPMLIGLTIVAFGTSSPEFAVSIQSLISNNGDMILGNVIGSNILNTFLILGVCALFHSLTVKNNTVKKELPIALLLTSLFIVLMADGMFSLGENSFTRQDGIVLLLFFLVFIYYLISMMRNKVDADQDTPIKYNKFKSALLTILGIVGIIMGSRFVVDGASTIAEILGVSQRMISLTIVALGTSLPELATSVAATRKGEYDIAIGNVIGSNIFNIGIVVGLPVAILGGINNIAFNYVDLGVLFVASLVLFIFSFNDRKITKAEGIMMLMLFLTYYSYVIFF